MYVQIHELMNKYYVWLSAAKRLLACQFFLLNSFQEFIFLVNDVTHMNIYFNFVVDVVVYFAFYFMQSLYYDVDDVDT